MADGLNIPLAMWKQKRPNETEGAALELAGTGSERLLDASKGSISRILLAVSDYSAQTFETAVQSVLRGLPGKARLDILVSPGAMDTVSGWLAASGSGALAYLIEAPDDLSFSLWTQDVFLAHGDGTLLIPPHLDRYQDHAAAILLAKGAQLEAKHAPLYFEGGNLIAAGDLLLIGEDSIVQSGTDLPTFQAAIDPSRRPVVLGTDLDLGGETTRQTDRPAPGWSETTNWRLAPTSRQPLFHIDLFIAPAGTTETGRPRFLVGCPRRGAAALGHPLWPGAQADAFDQIAEQLADEGAEVIRNPMPLIWKDNEQEKHRTWYHLPVNNVLVEEAGDHDKTVWLPCFSSDAWPELQAVDNTNAAIWALMGYSVIRIPGLRELAENLGALHCMAKVVERS